MSDERDTRDGADAAGTGRARPTGKRPVRAGSSVATLAKRAAAEAPARSERKEQGRTNPFKALRKFLREVISELRKVIWPNKKQMVTYTAVVLVFVVFMVAFISGLDVAFVKGVDWLFG